MPNGPSEDAAADRTAAERPRGLGHIARRWRRWAVNLLASGVILIAGLTFARQVVLWWHAGPPQPVDHVADVVGPPGLGSEGLLHAVRFGAQRLTWYRTTVFGDQRAVLTVLRQQCRQLVETAAPPAGPPGAAERAWLARAVRLEPVERQPGQWAIYQQPEPIPIAVAVRYFPAAGREQAASNGVQPPGRVVCWSLAVPEGGQPPAWTVLAFAEGSPSGTPAAASSLPLPEGFERVMAIGAAGSGQLVAFRTAAPPATAMRRLDAVASHWDCEPAGKWSVRGSSGYRQFRRVGDGRSLHVMLSSSCSGGTEGIIVAAGSSAKQ